VDGKKIKAVMASNKTGFLYVFDRVTGKPVWPIEERPVPKSTIPGEETWPTQPFPTRPPAFDQQGSSEADLIDYTPSCMQRRSRLRATMLWVPCLPPRSSGAMIPNGKRGTLEIPGGWGAGNWNNGCIRSETGIYYAVSQTQAGGNGLTKNPDANALMPVRSGPARNAQQARAAAAGLAEMAAVLGGRRWVRNNCRERRANRAQVAVINATSI